MVKLVCFFNYFEVCSFAPLTCVACLKQALEAAAVSRDILLSCKTEDRVLCVFQTTRLMCDKVMKTIGCNDVAL